MCLLLAENAFIVYLCKSMTKNLLQYSQMIKAEAKELGFLFYGISKAEFLEEEAPKLEAWLKKRHAGRNALHGKSF